jgi:hypothetical protein
VRDATHFGAAFSFAENSSDRPGQIFANSSQVVRPSSSQPALAAYCPDPDGSLRLHTLQVLTVTPDGISRNVVFQVPHVFEIFGLDLLLSHA